MEVFNGKLPIFLIRHLVINYSSVSPPTPRSAIAAESGRTPKINTAPGGGRDHWSRAYSIQLIGGGIRGGVVYGATDQHAAEVADFPVKPDDIAATIFELLGIPHELILHDQKGQPHKISEGHPLHALMT